MSSSPMATKLAWVSAATVCVRGRESERLSTSPGAALTPPTSCGRRPQLDRSATPNTNPAAWPSLGDSDETLRGDPLLPACRPAGR
jgi:hypothetical protein